MLCSSYSLSCCGRRVLLPQAADPPLQAVEAVSVALATAALDADFAYWSAFHLDAASLSLRAIFRNAVSLLLSFMFL